MADPFFSRDANRLARRAFRLAPVRSLRFQAAVWLFACGFSALAGAFVMHFSGAQRTAASRAQCVSPPVDQDAEQSELVRTRLALAQESAARAAVQKVADSKAAELASLSAELQFLRGQSKPAPRARH